LEPTREPYGYAVILGRISRSEYHAINEGSAMGLPV